jgi:hypothetical protein
LRPELVPTAQRRAIRWLGVSAGLVGVAAIAAGVVWATSYQRAVALAQPDANGNVSMDNATQSAGQVETSNQARVGTAICISIGGALAVATVALNWF